MPSSKFSNRKRIQQPPPVCKSPPPPPTVPAPPELPPGRILWIHATFAGLDTHGAAVQLDVHVPFIEEEPAAYYYTSYELTTPGFHARMTSNNDDTWTVHCSWKFEDGTDKAVAWNFIPYQNTPPIGTSTFPLPVTNPLYQSATAQLYTPNG